VGHARTLLASLDWWKLEPRREALRVNGNPNPLPTATDLTPPHAAAIGAKTWAIYLPRGNAICQLQIATSLAAQARYRWFDPRTGGFVGEAGAMASALLPARPHPVDEDWVLLIE
jgi:hypothetical protein